MLTQEKKLLLIGQVAALCGLPIKTIRYYADLGLLKTLDRTEGGYRQFSSEVLTRLAFIKRSQSLGLIPILYEAALNRASRIKS